MPSWQTRSTWPMSMPSSSDAVATSARSFPSLSRCLGVEPGLLGEAAVVRGDRLLAQPFGELPRDPLRHPAGIDEDERGPVRLDQARAGGRRPRPRPPPTSRPRAGNAGSSSARSIERAAGGLDDLRRALPPPPATRRPPRSAPSSPRARSAGAARGPHAPAAPGSAPGGPRAGTPAPRGSRPRSRCARCAASPGSARRSAGGRATRAW